MTMRNKLAAAMAKGVETERDRCLRLCTELITALQKGVRKKLMTAQEKHIAETKLKIGQAIVGAIQMKIMTGAQLNAKTKASDVHGRDADALGGP